MDEGTKDRERQTIVADLFPIREQSIIAALGTLDLEEEKRILSNDNGHILDSFEELGESYSEDKAGGWILGTLICYRALREEGRFRGGYLPRLTKQFVESYDKEEEEDVEKEIIDKPLLRISEVGGEIRRAKVVKFRNFEPEFSKAIEKEFGGQQDWSAENDYRYLGIINLYLMFRRGCSDPKNFVGNI